MGIAIFHTVYDLDDRYQVPGAQYVHSGKTYEHNGDDGAAGGHLRRPGPLDGGDVPQHGSGRLLGACRQSGVSGEVLGAWAADRSELRDLLHDSLGAGSEPDFGANLRYSWVMKGLFRAPIGLSFSAILFVFS